MAKVIVRRAAAQTADRAELCSILSDTITDPESRRRFVAAFNKAGGGQSSTGASGVRSGTGRAAGTRTTARGPRRAPAATVLEPSYIDQVTAQLAVYIGPIAQVLTRKAARESRTRQEFVRRCAENLGTQDARRFLRELGYD